MLKNSRMHGPGISLEEMQNEIELGKKWVEDVFVLSWGIPNRPPETPEEEFTVQKVWIDKALSEGLDYVSLVYHPHSIYRMSEKCETIALIMQYIQNNDITTTTVFTK